MVGGCGESLAGVVGMPRKSAGWWFGRWCVLLLSIWFPFSLAFCLLLFAFALASGLFFFYSRLPACPKSTVKASHLTFGQDEANLQSGY